MFPSRYSRSPVLSFGPLLTFAASCLALMFSACSHLSTKPRIDDSFPTRFEVSVGGALGDSYSIRLEGDHLRYEATTASYFNTRTRTRRIQPTPQAWRKFWFEADSVGMWKWRSKYEPPKGVIVNDGTQWHIAISYKGRSMASDGDNAYPSDANPRRSVMDGPTTRFSKFDEAVQHLIGR